MRCHGRRMHTSPLRSGRLRAPAAARAAMAVAALLLTLALAPSAGAAVYWTNGIAQADIGPGTTIGRASLDGTGSNQAFVQGASQPCGIAADRAHVYWTNSDRGTIGRANLDGTGVDQNFIAGATGACGLAVDGAHIYWSNVDNVPVFGAGSIGRANLDGTGVNQRFITGALNPVGVAVDGAHVYWANNNSHAIGRANLDGTGVNQSYLDVGLTGQPMGVAVDGAHVYWADLLSNKIGRANIDGTGANPAFIDVGPSATPFGVAVDAAHLYWTDFLPNSADGADGAVGRANLDGSGANPTFITGARSPMGVAVDAAGQAQPPARIAIDDVTAAEGNAGQTTFRFTASLDAPQPAPVTVRYATGDGTATAPGDYAATSGTVTFAAGETAKPVTVQVNGDTAVEPSETFTVNLGNATGNAVIADPTGVGTITDDDQTTVPAGHISIADLRLAEGNTGQTAFRFTASLDRAQPAPVTVRFATRNGTASAPSDYIARSGTLTFAAGETAKVVTVQVNGDRLREADETFGLDLSSVTGNATISDGHAVGRIVNDDRSSLRRRRAARHRHFAGRRRFLIVNPRVTRAARLPFTSATVSATL
jgi:virginiamycin B lyase